MKAKTKRKNKIFLSNGDILASRLKSRDLSLEEVHKIISTFDDTFFESSSLELELLIANGFPLEINKIKNEVYLKTARQSLKNQIFCIVDIETNGSDARIGQIIEIGAVKYQNGKIIDKYESLVYAKDIPPYIQEVTNINPSMLENAPSLKVVLEEFKMFLEDDVFVAHNIKFDYTFISDSFEKNDLGKLENRKFCSIDLAKRTINAPKYGLEHLKEVLDIRVEGQHRAFSDALSTSFVLQISLDNLDSSIQTAEDLIKFSKSDNIINPIKHIHRQQKFEKQKKKVNEKKNIEQNNTKEINV